jgi:hypothetical protein
MRCRDVNAERVRAEHPHRTGHVHDVRRVIDMTSMTHGADLHATAAPSNGLSEKDLCPGAAKLDRTNASSATTGRRPAANARPAGDCEIAITDQIIGKAGDAALTPYCGTHDKCAIFDPVSRELTPSRTQEPIGGPRTGWEIVVGLVGRFA